MKKNVATGLAAAAAIVVCASAAQAAEMPDVRILVTNCFNCHGTNGMSVGVIDELDQLPARRITSKMIEFKTDKKASTIMNRIAKGYNEAEIEAMAQYIEKANAGKGSK